jgi:hypothetical protein
MAPVQSVIDWVGKALGPDRPVTPEGILVPVSITVGAAGK